MNNNVTLMLARTATRREHRRWLNGMLFEEYCRQVQTEQAEESLAFA